MAKQIVREYDNSTGTLPSYSNFAVLVPGYVNSDKLTKFAEVSDENDVYEVSSLSDFLDNVGQVSGTGVPAVAPTLTVLGYLPGTNTTTETTETTEAENTENTENTETAEDTEANTEDTEAGTEDSTTTESDESDNAEENSEENTDTTETTETVTDTKIPQYYKSMTVQEVVEYVTAGTLYQAGEKKSTDPEKGRLIDANYRYTKITADNMREIVYTDTENPHTQLANFCVIEAGNEGQNERVGGQMGNQIAYELLQLGYTVLYKGFGAGTKLEYNLGDLQGPDFWKPFRDKSIYSFRYIISGGDYSTGTMNRMIELAEFNNDVTLEEAETILDNNGRGDVIALCDVDEALFNVALKGTIGNIINTNQAAAEIRKSKYAAIFAPRVIYSLPAADINDYDNNNIFPASFHYLACAAYVHSNFAEWYAIAGYNRGVSALTVKGVTVNYGNVAQNTLGPRTPLKIDADNKVEKAINLIISERGSYYLWGNRTALGLEETGLKWSHYLNIRQLCTTIKKQVIYAGRMYAFDPNSDILWINFRDAIEPLLQKMEGDQGIDGHKIVPVKNNVKGCLKAKIRIVPIEAVEDFDIGLYLDESIPGATVDAVESD